MITVLQTNGKRKRKSEILNKSSVFLRYTKKGVLFFVVLCTPFVFWKYTQTRKTSLLFLDQHGIEHTLSLSVEDKNRLFCLMHLLFAEDNFAYTLLGSKPVSWATYREPFPFVNFSRFRNSMTRYHRTLRLGWEVWLKYRHLFPPIIFLAESSRRHPGSVSILIVNEEQFNRVVNDYKQDFQDVLHREITDGFQLLKEAQNSSLIDDVLQGHQALIGIVLGYGRDNSWEFLARSEKREPLGWVWDEVSNQKQQGVRVRRGGANTEECLLLESCPSFAGNPHSEESLVLKKDYLLTQQQVINYYKNKDFLEATLSLLAGFRPNCIAQD